MSSSDVFVGIDFSQSVFKIGVLPQSLVWEWSNDERTVTELVNSLVALSPALVTIEGKGKALQRLRSQLQEVGLSVSVVKPSQMQEFVKDLGVLNNTHAIYAMVLARHGQLAASRARCRDKREAGEFEALLMRRCQLAEMLSAERVRLGTGAKRVRREIEAHIRWLENCLKEIDQDTSGIVTTTPICDSNTRLVGLIPGAGPTW